MISPEPLRPDQSHAVCLSDPADRREQAQAWLVQLAGLSREAPQNKSIKSNSPAAAVISAQGVDGERPAREWREVSCQLACACRKLGHRF
jgi:hypothetical protein